MVGLPKGNQILISKQSACNNTRMFTIKTSFAILDVYVSGSVVAATQNKVLEKL